ncbi:hypothetical protein DFJ58DRAFT_718685 [Suillus subalutaceus]|uniref:uncharacterized protein n=1 Tax=Suillus subalutaceus TaxID=48586 RepID=UPI001B85C9EF|nr:uncharacterized protein DFJ58DRAFT_718685 [Suillus subalutaceus]KAG1838734.1 hypothetical protein DFJ58DRAFT_718685 [Suillus subalutaceus]
MLKRAGRGHDPASVVNMQSGECAVLCPTCPQPLENLPDNWKDVLNDKRSINTNFRLKRCIVSKDTTDPVLSHGWAYFVDEMAYKVYLQGHAGKPQEGLAATEVGTIDCAQHNVKLPNGVGDLQKGERYSNMDYLFLSTLCGHCWHKNLWECMSTMPPSLHLDPLTKLISFSCLCSLIHCQIFVPKFHLLAHIFKCQTTYLHNTTPKDGRGS